MTLSLAESLLPGTGSALCIKEYIDNSFMVTPKVRCCTLGGATNAPWSRSGTGLLAPRATSSSTSGAVNGSGQAQRERERESGTAQGLVLPPPPAQDGVSGWNAQNLHVYVHRVRPPPDAHGHHHYPHPPRAGGGGGSGGASHAHAQNHHGGSKQQQQQQPPPPPPPPQPYDVLVIADDGRGIGSLDAFDEALSIIGHTEDARPTAINQHSISRCALWACRRAWRFACGGRRPELRPSFRAG